MQFRGPVLVRKPSFYIRIVFTLAIQILTIIWTRNKDLLDFKNIGVFVLLFPLSCQLLVGKNPNCPNKVHRAWNFWAKMCYVPLRWKRVLLLYIYGTCFNLVFQRCKLLKLQLKGYQISFRKTLSTYSSNNTMHDCWNRDFWASIWAGASESV